MADRSQSDSYRLVKIILRHILYLLALSLSLPVSGFAQRVIDTMPGSFDEHIRTLQCTLDDNFFAPPLINLGTDDILSFSFDNLAEDRAYFRYRLIHCNADWQPSGLVDSEFLDGFNEASVEDYAFSRSTTVNYVNYRFTIPNNDIQPLVSGNYLLQLYEETDPDRVLAQWRFMVSEQKASITSSVTSRTDIDYNEGHQQLSIAVTTDRLDVTDPFNDLIVMIQQNNRLDNEVALRHPLRMSGRTAVYEHQNPLIFDAGNEYRRFETVSVNYPGMNIENTEYIHPYYHSALYTDSTRDNLSYSFDSTQNGRFKIREYDSDDPDTQADYIIVHFTLDYPYEPDTMIFLDGDFTGRRFDESSRMTFNPVFNRYEKAVLLKQGAYNYQYLTVPKGRNRGFTSFIEGDKYQTANEYLIKVYTRRPGERYDRLIGVSRNIFQ